MTFSMGDSWSDLISREVMVPGFFLVSMLLDSSGGRGRPAGILASGRLFAMAGVQMILMILMAEVRGTRIHRPVSIKLKD